MIGGGGWWLVASLGLAVLAVSVGAIGIAGASAPTATGAGSPLAWFVPLVLVASPLACLGAFFLLRSIESATTDVIVVLGLPALLAVIVGTATRRTATEIAFVAVAASVTTFALGFIVLNVLFSGFD